MSMNNKGFSGFNMIITIFLFLFIVIILGIYMVIFNFIDTSLDIDIDVGQVNLQDLNNQTFGQINDGFQSQGDNLGLVILLGMSVVMFINAYYTGRKSKRLMLVVDFLILIFVFILAVYVSQAYETLILASTDLDIYTEGLPETSSFMLNLPIWTGTIGALIMIFSYAGIRKEEDRIDVVDY